MYSHKFKCSVRLKYRSFSEPALFDNFRSCMRDAQGLSTVSSHASVDRFYMLVGIWFLRVIM